ncbi:MAG: transporter ATP-binding protein [Oscillospiraceae bacterium]|jgi:ATP-binding cassette subfamily B protein|nr:transporter ATP-binding protein [Oscillospiraceae bacterium]
MLSLAKYLKNFKKEVIFGPAFKLLEAVFELIVPLVMANIIDVGVKNKDISYVLKMGAVILILGFIGLIFSLTCQYLASKASQGFGTMVRNDMFRHINSFSHFEIDKIGTSSLITRITSDINQLQVAVAMLIRLVVRAPFLVIGATAMAMILDIQLSLVFLVATPFVALVLIVVMRKSIPFYKSIQKKLDNILLITRENLEGIRVVRAFSKQKIEKKRFEDTSDDLAKTVIKVGKISALLNPLTSIIMNGAIIAILWFGGMRVDSGVLTQGQIIAFVNYMTQILLSLIVVANLFVLFTKASASAARVNEVFEIQSSITDKYSEIEIGKTDPESPRIEFKNVSFSYHQEESEDYALENISIKIFPGETIGIIGGTGSGKSTLVNLIPRFYDTTKGQVLVDGIDVKEYSFKSLRAKMGLVPQKAVLFSGTVADNLKLGCEEATEEQMKKALDIAQASEFVEKLPNRYEEMIFQGGKNLSGGQKQRLTIARALVGNPQILILDDSASALDFATDVALRKALKKETDKMTVIIVSQRVNSIKHADNIIVLDDGKIVGTGMHSSLYESCGLYQEICLSQLNQEEAQR